jgi:hypothetical protein
LATWRAVWKRLAGMPSLWQLLTWWERWDRPWVVDLSATSILREMNLHGTRMWRRDNRPQIIQRQVAIRRTSMIRILYWRVSSSWCVEWRSLMSKPRVLRRPRLNLPTEMTRSIMLNRMGKQRSRVGVLSIARWMTWRRGLRCSPSRQRPIPWQTCSQMCKSTNKLITNWTDKLTRRLICKHMIRSSDVKQLFRLRPLIGRMTIGIALQRQVTGWETTLIEEIHQWF